MCKRKDNLKRHEDESHRKVLKTCACGKQFTASALSRHKHECERASAGGKMPDLSAWNISRDQIASVVDQTIKVKFVTLNDGTVLTLHNDINVGGCVYTLTLTPIVSDGNK